MQRCWQQKNCTFQHKGFKMSPISCSVPGSQFQMEEAVVEELLQALLMFSVS